MKRFLLFLTVCFIGFIIYFDLTTGTLPAFGAEARQAAKPYPEQTEKASIPYTDAIVKPGDTLLTIIEKEKGGQNVSIEIVIEDFQELNKGLKPEEMQIGKTYKIPSYKK
ncbi:LysM domain-containing protein [Peribacillus cavernae]|uniref:LysM domain-containing protein n=2 Tax=Peribacillus cavernae TaxID=1674310 RepID=A0A3S0UCM1_9BACI|nr:LysM domain-containing protein [Peribacillus cavernae]